MRHIFYILLFLLAGVTDLTAMENENKDSGKYSVQQLWEIANNFYSEGDFSSALSHYTMIEERGYSSLELLYNKANTYFKLDQKGKAILLYERALRLNPSNKDIQNNLKHAREFTIDRIDQVPEFVLTTWIRQINYIITSNLWAYLSIIFLALSAALFLNFRYGASSGIRKLSFFAAVFILLLSITCSLFSWSQRNAWHLKNEAIVMMPVSSIRSSPAASGTTIFVLHEGTKVKKLEELGPWMRIELTDGRQGWIQSSDIEAI